MITWGRTYVTPTVNTGWKEKKGSTGPPSWIDPMTHRAIIRPPKLVICLMVLMFKVLQTGVHLYVRENILLEVKRSFSHYKH